MRRLPHVSAALRAPAVMAAFLPPALAVWLLLAAAAPAAAQNSGVGYREPANLLSGGPSFRSWKVKSPGDTTETITQIHVPFLQTVPLGPNADIVAFGSWASTKLKPSRGAESSLTGFTDFRLKGIWRPGGRGMLSAGVNLPVGKRTIEVSGTGGDELAVAQAMWSPILGMRTKRMGEGFDFEFGAGWAAPLSPKATLGLGAGYAVKGEYDLFRTSAGVTRFKPGAEASASLGIDFRPDQGTLLRVDVAGRRFAEDKSGGEPVFQSGTQVEIDAVFGRDTPGWTLAIRGRNVSRSDDNVISGTGSAITRTTVTPAGLLFGLAEVYRKAGPSVAVGAEVEVASFGRSGAALSDGTTLAVGPGLRIGSAGGSRVSARALYLTGNAQGGDVKLSGFDATLAVTLAF